jgi:signal transduction histidine kinase
LAVFITGLYVGIVVGVGYLLGAHDEPNPWLGLAATVVVATAFQPMRRGLQRVANRVVYGRRATPYEVLSTFSQRVAGVDPEVIGLIARSLVEGTTARSVSIWMNRGTRTTRIAHWPEELETAAVTGPDQIPGADRLTVVAHDGQTLGFVAVDLEPGQPFTTADEKLLAQVSSGLGLALKNLLLTEDLRDRVEQLRQSRQRIVAVQDRTRRQLERDLHDGAQQRLVALKIKLGIGVAMAGKAGAEDVGDVLRGVQADTDQTIESVRDFARGIYPPLLEAEGLGPALAGQVRKLPIPVTVHTAGLGRHSKEIEATVYFCVLEALQNAARHSGASSVMVTIRDDAGFLIFRVTDDGDGFDPHDANDGHGLTNLADRVDVLGGELDLRSAPGRGTTIEGTVPIPELVPA